MVGDKEIKLFKGWKFKNWLQAVCVLGGLALVDVAMISLLIGLILL